MALYAGLDAPFGNMERNLRVTGEVHNYKSSYIKLDFPLNYLGALN
jgi:hypothetical protein